MKANHQSQVNPNPKPITSAAHTGVEVCLDTSTSVIESAEMSELSESGKVQSDGSTKCALEKVHSWGLSREVVHCKELPTEEQIAVMPAWKKRETVTEEELAILEELRKLDREKNNLVMFTDHFMDDGRLCLKFEKLDMSLFDLMAKRSFDGLSLSEIRVVTQQLLVALNALKSIGLIHTDIKPENVMLVNHEKQPFKLKLVYFGLAQKCSTIKQMAQVQLLGYRAPEVILGCPVNEAIDMWSLGCLMAFMYMGETLLPTNSKYENIRIIRQMMGQPDDNMLNNGGYSCILFNKHSTGSGHRVEWRFRTRQDFENVTRQKVKPYMGFTDKCTSLNEVLMAQNATCEAEGNDAMAFLSLLKQMLQLDPKIRIRPSEALGCNFITMNYFPRDSNDEYVNSAFKTMADYQLAQSSVECTPSTMSSEEHLNRLNSTCSDKPYPSEKETTAENEKGQPATVESDKTSASCDDQELPGTNDATPSSSIISKPPAKKDFQNRFIDGADRNLQGASAAGLGKESGKLEGSFHDSGNDGSKATVGSEETTGAVTSNSSVTPANNGTKTKIVKRKRCFSNLWAKFICWKNRCY